MMFLDGPSPTAPLSQWEAWLKRLQTMPFSDKTVRSEIAHAKKIIDILREEEAVDKLGCPDVGDDGEPLVFVDVKLRVLDEEPLQSHAALLVGNPVPSLDEAICEAVVSVEGAPLDHGFEIVKKVVMPIDGPLYLLRVTCRIFTAAEVIAEAKRRYSVCWEDDAWEPSSITEALYEVLIASNANPPPCDLGVEIVYLRQPESVFPPLPV